jgi:hypothetical protein
MSVGMDSGMASNMNTPDAWVLPIPSLPNAPYPRMVSMQGNINVPPLQSYPYHHMPPPPPQQLQQQYQYQLPYHDPYNDPLQVYYRLAVKRQRQDELEALTHQNLIGHLAFGRR